MTIIMFSSPTIITLCLILALSVDGQYNRFHYIVREQPATFYGVVDRRIFARQPVSTPRFVTLDSAVGQRYPTIQKRSYDDICDKGLEEEIEREWQKFAVSSCYL